MKCPYCGSENADDAKTCAICMKEVFEQEHAHKKVKEEKPEECVHWSEAPAAPARSAKVGMAALFILLAGVMGITHAVISLTPGVGEDLLNSYEGWIPQGEALSEIIANSEIIAVVMFMLGVLAVAGAMLVFTRARFKTSILLSICGVLSVGFLIGAFLGLVGVLLLITCKKEFELACA